MYIYFFCRPLSPSKQLWFGMCARQKREQNTHTAVRGCGTSVAEQRKVIFHPFASIIRRSTLRLYVSCFTVHIILSLRRWCLRACASICVHVCVCVFFTLYLQSFVEYACRKRRASCTHFFSYGPVPNEYPKKQT